jgi:hypothetical protein
VQGGRLNEFRRLLHLRMMRSSLDPTLARGYNTANADPGHSNWRSEGRTSVKLLRRSARLLESAEPIGKSRNINSDVILYLGSRIEIVRKKDMYGFYAVGIVCF